MNVDKTLKKIVLLTVAEIVQATGYTRQSIHRLVKNNEFPAPLKLQPQGAVRWRLTDIEEWVDSKAVKQS